MHLRYLQYPTGPLQLAFKEAYFWDFTIPVVPCFYISHCIRFSWHWSRGNRELYEGLRAHNVQFHPGSIQCFCGTPATQWPITELQALAGWWWWRICVSYAFKTHECYNSHLEVPGKCWRYSFLSPWVTGIWFSCSGWHSKHTYSLSYVTS